MYLLFNTLDSNRNEQQRSLIEMKNRLLSTLTALGVLVALSSGLGVTTATASTGRVTNLTIWTGFSGGDRPGYEQIVKNFNVSHPSIHVTMQIMPWDTITQKLPSAWLTGQGPDIASPNFDPNVIAQYVKTQSVLPLTDIGAGSSKINVSKFAPGAAAEFTYNNKLFAVPANFATLSLYYNKKMFAAAGIKTPPATVAAFQEDAKKLTIDSGKTQYGLVLADHATIQMWPVLQWISGGDIVDSAGCSVLQNAADQNALKTWSDLVVNENISPVGLTGGDADSLFSAGKAAMEMNGPWAASGFKAAGIDFGLAKIPTGVNGDATLGSIAPLAISAKTKYPRQAQEFLAYWTSSKVQRTFSLATGFPPMRTDLSSDKKLMADPIVSIFAEQVPNSHLYLPHLQNASQVDANAYVPLIGFITRGKSVTTATTDAAKLINSLTGCNK